MELGHVIASPRVQLRNDAGQFIARAREGADAAERKLAEDVASWAKIFAPKGRTRALVNSIRTVAFGQGVAAIAGGPFAYYAEFQEKGAAPHIIESTKGARGLGGEGVLANEEEGFFSGDGIVLHPGNPATHFLLRAGQTVNAYAAQVVADFMPGF